MSKSKNPTDPEMPCYKCCHSASNAPFPGRPSGERPCQFCTRNPNREDPPKVDVWYDGGKPVNIPMDCYHSIDMFAQFNKFEDMYMEATKALQDYFVNNYPKIIDHSIRVSVINDDKHHNRVELYIHADGKDSDTLNFVLENGKMAVAKFEQKK